MNLLWIDKLSKGLIEQLLYAISLYPQDVIIINENIKFCLVS